MYIHTHLPKKNKSVDSSLGGALSYLVAVGLWEVVGGGKHHYVVAGLAFWQLETLRRRATNMLMSDKEQGDQMISWKSRTNCRPIHFIYVKIKEQLLPTKKFSPIICETSAIVTNTALS
jgi:hypothetical protein